jgi:hypothetical protein
MYPEVHSVEIFLNRKTLNQPGCGDRRTSWTAVWKALAALVVQIGPSTIMNGTANATTRAKLVIRIIKTKAESNVTVGADIQNAECDEHYPFIRSINDCING